MSLAITGAVVIVPLKLDDGIGVGHLLGFAVIQSSQTMSSLEDMVSRIISILHFQYLEYATASLWRVEQNQEMPVRKQLSRTQADHYHFGQQLSDGVEVSSGDKIVKSDKAFLSVRFSFMF
ncbi:unnamed protein product [Clavelina lepadiformis]|uniref:Uncharacterized protein n=1 Tax=Clavelina lepadiformis TaxID=159417 RepID=A0ABP0H0X8_CLALP